MTQGREIPNYSKVRILPLHPLQIASNSPRDFATELLCSVNSFATERLEL